MIIYDELQPNERAKSSGTWPAIYIYNYCTIAGYKIVLARPKLASPPDGPQHASEPEARSRALATK